MADGNALALAQARQRQARAQAMIQMAPEGPAIPSPVMPQPDVVRDVRQSLMQGMTAEFGDEITAAAIAALDSDMTFDQALQMQRERLEQMPTGLRVGGSIAGAMVPATGLLRAPTTIGQAARQGAGMGGAFGAGAAEGGPMERAAGAAIGAGTGAALGGTMQGAIQGIGRAIARARQGVDRATARAMDRVLLELQQGDITVQQAANRVQRLGGEGILADVPELQRLAQSAASRTAAGERVARSALEGRRAGAGTRVERALDDALGGQDLRQARQQFVRRRAEDAAETYGEALNVGPLRRTEALEDLIGTADGQGGSQLVRGTLASLRRSNPRFRDVPDTDPLLLHEVRVTLGERSRGAGAPKRNINDVVQQLTDAMDDAGAIGYRQAVNEFRSNSAIIDAFDQGRRALNELPETVEAFLREAPEGEATAFVAGLGRESLRRLTTGETGSAALAVRGLLRGERAQVLRESLGPEGFNAFRNRLLRELRFAETQGRVIANSLTQPRQATAAEQARRGERVVRAGQRLREGTPVGAVAELLTAAERGGPRVAEERALAQLLFRSQGQGLPAGRFQSPTPLLELAERQRLLGGAGALTSPLRGAARGGAGSGGGSAASALLNLAGF